MPFSFVQDLMPIIAPLQSKLKEKCSGASESISLASEQDVYNGVIASCIQLLAQDLEASGCEAPLAVMAK